MGFHSKWYLDTRPVGRFRRLALLGVFIVLIAASGIHFINRALVAPDEVKEGTASASILPGATVADVRQVASTVVQQKFTKYTVRRGDFIISIAQRLGVPWESIVVANEHELALHAAQRCDKLSPEYRKNPHRRGRYCNELVTIGSKPMVSANSLQPGDVLRIPSRTAPVSIQETINNVSGNKIAIVIDETGSMAGDDGEDDRERVASWYLQAVKNAGKQIGKVVMFADGHVRELEAEGINFQIHGGFENTRHALEWAKSYHPDAIVLITDEPGDDWHGFYNLNLPPVIAHSLHPYADASLQKVARLTGGTFLRSHSGPIALSAP